MKRTLKRELKVLEIAEREAIGPSTVAWWQHLVTSQHQLGLRDILLGEVQWPCSGGIPLLKPGFGAAGLTEVKMFTRC